MSQPSDRLREHLLPEEPLRGVYAATLSDNSSPKEVSVGMTDRRLLALAEDGTVLNVGYDSICAIRSRPRSTLTYRGNDSRLLVGGGASLSVLGFGALVALAPNPAVPALALATVAALVATVALYRADDASELVTVEEIDERTAADFEVADGLRSLERALPDVLDGRRALLLAGALLAVLAFAGTVVAAATVIVALFFPPILGGLALVEYGRRHRGELGGIELARERARNVRISTDDGRTIRLEVDPSADADRELSRLAFGDGDESRPSLSTRPRDDATATGP